jgi:ubiquinone/menaquinone biosynthesis C-methylase UbiE
MVEEQDQIKDIVEKVFDQSSTNYDTFIGETMKQLTNLLLREMTIPKNPIALDIACGTGISTIEFIKKSKGQGTFYGIDLSKPMLNKAKQNTTDYDKGNIHFMKMDAQNLDFPDDMFDTVICNMSLQFFPDQEKALREMYRVLKPGGSVGILCEGKMAGKEVKDVVLSVANRHHEIPEFMKSVVEFHNGFLDLEEMVGLFELVGFCGSLIYGRHRFTFVHPEGSFNDTQAYWGVYRSSLPLGVVDDIRDELMSEMRSLSVDRGFQRTSYLIIGVGIKPDKP